MSKKLETAFALYTDECKHILPLLAALGVQVTYYENVIELVEGLDLRMKKKHLEIVRRARKSLHTHVKGITKQKRFPLAKQRLNEMVGRVEKIKQIAIDKSKLA
jgi:hypothetical protein